MQLRILRTYEIVNVPQSIHEVDIGGYIPTQRVAKDTLQYLTYYEGEEIWRNVPIVDESGNNVV